jgi:hypothetical protein
MSKDSFIHNGEKSREHRRKRRNRNTSKGKKKE